MTLTLTGSRPHDSQHMAMLGSTNAMPYQSHMSMAHIDVDTGPVLSLLDSINQECWSIPITPALGS